MYNLTDTQREVFRALVNNGPFELKNLAIKIGNIIDSGSSDIEFGFFDYNDGSTAIAPLDLVANTWTDVPNDGSGPFTQKAYAPSGVSEILDESTGYIDMTELNLGSEIVVRNDFTVTPQTNNSLLEARYLLGSGAGQYPLQFLSERLDSGSGIPYPRVTSFDIYVGDANTRDNPARLQVRLSTDGTLVNAGSYIKIKAVL